MKGLMYQTNLSVSCDKHLVRIFIKKKELRVNIIWYRFKKLPDGSIKHINKKPVLECVFIQRKDNNEWAIPGGMVEPGTAVSLTLVKVISSERALLNNRLVSEVFISRIFRGVHQYLIYAQLIL